ncbi:uracil-DNA glycosylase family protein [Sediminibacter sp. Hel_I_10]|uniref:uracil-DNA glycosylase family protein n=1 Tax=Sediminibacter sp. Hel_I_10 TaxID=1392490 RepID=UPI00047DA3C1|nr:uracil-DNA glycosylase family protein [Sediminibacter sp. Hel_I_10]
MFFHKHPYPPFIKDNSTKLIVGTLPPPRFTTGELLEKDVDFCYGSYHNSLWKFIDAIYNLNLRYDNSEAAVNQRKSFLTEHCIGVCDIVESAKRDKIDASDLGMKEVKLRDLIGILKHYPNIEMLVFIGGNSKNGPEYFFRKQLREHGLKLKLVSKEAPKIHEFEIDIASNKSILQSRTIKTVSLTSSSGAANISISRSPLYQQLKANNPDFNTFDFRVMQYQDYL